MDNPVGLLLPWILILGVFYLLLIRPQQQRAKRHRELVGSIARGDRIVTIGGLHGTVIDAVDEDTLRLEVSPGTVVTLARQAIGRKLVDADTGVAEDDGQL
ncbi:MAG TPA: preprotein translocase subunit YajC [Egibacteraceae bacterium]|nr:preprotein translocase subunit YajC [Egibacteraceae bacterium]